MRGEKYHLKKFFGEREGSPPRARGKDRLFLLPAALPGITPACAGKSQPVQVRRVPARDHPRVRGEKRREKPMNKRRKGSPPRARGKDNKMLWAAMMSGITPACAGKSLAQFRLMCGMRDHPRVRGEKLIVNEIHRYA